MPDPFENLLTSLIPIYPIVQQDFNVADRSEVPEPPVLDREQIQVSPDRRFLMVRHYRELHWCGYVPIPEAEWGRIHVAVFGITGLRMTYAGPSTQHICWMELNVSGRLRQPADKPDWWVGFATDRDLDYMRSEMYGLENTIWRLRRGDIGS